MTTNTQESTSLGSVLKRHRELISLTLRQVEEATGVSNAYISQLENHKIKHPSVNVLYKLSSLYGVSLDDLLFAAGFIKERTKMDIIEGKILLNNVPITTEEEQKLLDYLRWLRHKQ